MPYSDEELLAEIRRVATVADSDGAPTVTEFSEHSDIADSTIHRRFGSWNAGVAAAGFDPNPPEQELSETALIEELHRLRDHFEMIPTVSQMNDDGAYWASTYKNHFGSWAAALHEAFDDADIPRSRADAAVAEHDTRPVRLADETLLEELQRVGDKHGAPPRVQDMAAHGAHALQTYRTRFGSWDAALKEAGFDPQNRQHTSSHSQRVSTDALVADLHRLRDELGDRPTATDVVEDGKHGLATYQRRFGSWSDAVDTAFDNSNADQSTQ